jgi:hypothetical protein
MNFGIPSLKHDFTDIDLNTSQSSSPLPSPKATPKLQETQKITTSLFWRLVSCQCCISDEDQYNLLIRENKSSE